MLILTYFLWHAVRMKANFYTPEAIKCLWSTKDEFNMNSSTTLREYGKIWNNFSNLYDSTSSSQKARLRTAPAPQHYREWGNYSMYRITVLFVPKSERVQANTKLGARCRRKKGGGERKESEWSSEGNQLPKFRLGIKRKIFPSIQVGFFRHRDCTMIG